MNWGVNQLLDFLQKLYKKILAIAVILKLAKREWDKILPQLTYGVESNSKEMKAIRSFEEYMFGENGALSLMQGLENYAGEQIKKVKGENNGDNN